VIVHCQTCAADTILREGQDTCSWCGTKPLLLDKPRKEHPRGPTPYKIREPDVQEALRLYQSGLSLRQVAKVLWPRTTYKSEKSCAEALFCQFNIRGWELRSQSSVTAARNKANARSGRRADESEPAYRRRLKLERGAYQPACAGIILALGRNHGKPCTQHAMLGSDFCWAHSPESKAEREATCAKMRRRSDATIAARVAERAARRRRALELQDAGWKLKAIADELGYSRKAIGTIISRERRGVYA
jgi:hypothetical protein